MIIRLPGCWPIVIYGSRAHWKRNGTHHGPQSNPAVMALHTCQLAKPATGSTKRRFWLYVRGGYAAYVDIIIDRRERS